MPSKDLIDHWAAMERARTAAGRQKLRFKAPIRPEMVELLHREVTNFLTTDPTRLNVAPRELAAALNADRFRTYGGKPFEADDARHLRAMILRKAEAARRLEVDRLADLRRRMVAIIPKLRDEMSEADRSEAEFLALSMLEDRNRSDPALIRAGELVTDWWAADIED